MEGTGVPGAGKVNDAGRVGRDGGPSVGDPSGRAPGGVDISQNAPRSTRSESGTRYIISRCSGSYAGVFSWASIAISANWSYSLHSSLRAARPDSGTGDGLRSRSLSSSDSRR